MSLLLRILRLRCPHCGKSSLFINDHPYIWKGMGKMHKKCSNCGLNYSPEPGFYFGSTYFSYLFNVILIAIILIIFHLLGIDNHLIWIISISIAIILLSPYIFLLSRACWLAFFGKLK